MVSFTEDDIFDIDAVLFVNWVQTSIIFFSKIIDFFNRSSISKITKLQITKTLT